MRFSLRADFVVCFFAAVVTSVSLPAIAFTRPLGRWSKTVPIIDLKLNTATVFMTSIITKGGSDAATLVDLLPTIQEVFPNVTTYEIDATIEQDSAIGYKVYVDLPSVLAPQEEKEETEEENDEGPTNSGRKEAIFVKHVEVDYFVPKKKDWSDLRRSILYVRNEVRFYNEFAPLLGEDVSFIPKVYHAHINLDGWLPEDEVATCRKSLKAPPMLWETRNDNRLFVNSGGSSNPSSSKRGGTLVMECISEDSHYQDSPLTLTEAKKCLGAVAKLHAAAWENVELLKRAKERLSRASYHLSIRNPKELQALVDGWENFKGAFVNHWPQNTDREDEIANLGKRTFQQAEYISSQLSPNPEDPYATLIHGDYKSLNTFLPKTDDHDVLIVDYASTGIGNGMCDVAMHIHHAVRPELLDNGGEMELVQYYLDELRARLPPGAEYPQDVAMRHYHLAVVDYFRFFLGRFWKVATPETLVAKKSNKNVNLINRDIPSAMAFIPRVDRSLAEIETKETSPVCE